MFQFNFQKFDFWPIYERIKKFYPLGIEKIHPWRMYVAYPGLQKLTDIIVENIHDENNYNTRWTTFTTEIERLTGKEIEGTTNGQAPCFSAYVVLERIALGGIVRENQIRFFVSLVGPFYSVIGQEIISFQSEDRTYRTTGYLVASPENEFAEVFKLLCDKIEDRFKGFRFVPFEIGKQTIEGLDVQYSDEKLDSIFHALFNDHVELDSENVMGNVHYKYDDWIKEGYVAEEGGWTMYPPMG